MLKTANIGDELAAAEIRTALQGKRCWYAYAGFGCTVAVDLGRRIPRDKRLVALHRRLVREHPDAAADHPEEHLRHMGESHLLIWCSWRLDDAKSPLASSDGEPDQCEQAIQRMIGKTVRQVEIGGAWDLRLELSSGLVLSVFPDHVGDDASFDGNWELWRPEQVYAIETDLTCNVLDHENRPLKPGSRTGRWRLQDDAERARK